jgi:hypothetical protein
MAKALLSEYLGDAILGTGRERITNHVEYLSSQDGAMRLPALVAACLRLKAHGWQGRLSTYHRPAPPQIVWFHWRAAS